jgi:hypothetical protein
MPIEHILALLVEERDKINRAIEALGGIVKKQRGRPPKNPLREAVSMLAPPSVHGRKGRTFSATQRKQQAERMKAYWAKRKKAAKG